ncbi:hypothetical protein ACSU1N_00510 [Thermogladius sp. 4427co]|uniref:hypothetical protein n=1 Tax=Thermogladius sp. 4427co TaxID=3450718 RepID=UPI003F7A1492
MAEIGTREPTPAYYPVHVIPCETRSECPFFKIEKIDEDQCIAICTVADRVMTRSNVRKCVSSIWKECPFYKIGVESSSS